MYVPTVAVERVAEGDVNGDGTADLVALLTCNAGTDPGGVADQVVAFSAAGTGQYRTLAQVAWAAGGTNYLRQPEIVDSHTVRVLRMNAPDLYPPTSMAWQPYAWSGGQFVAGGIGPSMPWNWTPTELAVQASADAEGRLAITVTNHGGPASESVVLGLSSEVAAAIVHNGTRLARTDDDGYRWDIVIDPVPSGGSVTGTFTVQPDSTTSSSFDLSIVVSGRALTAKRAELWAFPAAIAAGNAHDWIRSVAKR